VSQKSQSLHDERSLASSNFKAALFMLLCRERSITIQNRADRSFSIFVGYSALDLVSVLSLATALLAFLFYFSTLTGKILIK